MNLSSLTLPAQVLREFLYIFFIITSLFISISRIKQRQMTWAAHSLDDDDVMSIASLKLKIIQLAAGFAIERGSKKQNEKLQFFPLSHFIFTQNFRFCTHFHLHVQPIRIADCRLHVCMCTNDRSECQIWYMPSLACAQHDNLFKKI